MIINKLEKAIKLIPNEFLEEEVEIYTEAWCSNSINCIVCVYYNNRPLSIYFADDGDAVKDLFDADESEYYTFKTIWIMDNM